MFYFYRTIFYQCISAAALQTRGDPYAQHSQKLSWSSLLYVLKDHQDLRKTILHATSISHLCQQKC